MHHGAVNINQLLKEIPRHKNIILKGGTEFKLRLSDVSTISSRNFTGWFVKCRAHNAHRGCSFFSSRFSCLTGGPLCGCDMSATDFIFSSNVRHHRRYQNTYFFGVKRCVEFNFYWKEINKTLICENVPMHYLKRNQS